MRRGGGAPGKPNASKTKSTARGWRTLCTLTDTAAPLLLVGADNITATAQCPDLRPEANPNQYAGVLRNAATAENVGAVLPLVPGAWAVQVRYTPAGAVEAMRLRAVKQ